MAVTDESHKIKHHLDGLRGHAESCALTSPRMFNAAIYALVCFCCQGRLLQRKRRRRWQRQRKLPKERPRPADAAISECCMARQHTILEIIACQQMLTQRIIICAT